MAAALRWQVTSDREPQCQHLVTVADRSLIAVA